MLKECDHELGRVSSQDNQFYAESCSSRTSVAPGDKTGLLPVYVLSAQTSPVSSYRLRTRCTTLSLMLSDNAISVLEYPSVFAW